MLDTRIIKEVVYSTIPNELIDQVFVFGSKARGDDNIDSDTDICIIIKHSLERNEIKAYRYRLNSIFASKHRMPTDILIKTNHEFNKYKDVVGVIENIIANEGIIA